MRYERGKRPRMELETKKFIYYQDEDWRIGWLEEYPDYRTQGSLLKS